MTGWPDPQERRRKLLFYDLDLPKLQGIEIGPLTAPLARKADGPVIYVDHVTTEQLISKYTGDKNVDVSDIVEVDAVWGDKTLVDVVGPESADYVVASHVGEHVPDFVGWVREIEAVLRPDGQLCLVLPDKRMSFDCRRRETSLTDVMDAFVRKARKPGTYQILEAALNVVRSDAVQMYLGEAAAADFPPIHTMASVLELARAALTQNLYIDVHCWAFTPGSFARLLGALVGHGLVGLSCAGFTDTNLANNFEFFVKLQKGRSTDDAVESWRRMEQDAAPHVRGSAAAQAAGLV